jgi:hypothetical protein
MFSLSVRKCQKKPRILYLEELESRALPSSVQPSAIFDTVQSTNWSGYGAETNLNTPASNVVTAVSGSWIVPKVTGNTNAFSSVWVGIDGFSSNSVEQLGTEQDTSRSGATFYSAWWEMFPNPSITITSMTISPGDSISASVTYSGGSFTLSMTDNTTGQSFSTTQSSAIAQRSSAEWIVEAPSSGGRILPLANFGTVNISKAQATINRTTGAIDDGSWQNTSIDMISKGGTVIAHTSGLTDSGGTSSFSVTFTGGGGGGGGHHHGHGQFDTMEVSVPTGIEVQPSASPEALPNPTTDSPAAEPPAVPAAEDLIVSAPATDAWSPSFPQTNEPGSTVGLRYFWAALQSGISNEDLFSSTICLNEFSQRL